MKLFKKLEQFPIFDFVKELGLRKIEYRKSYSYLIHRDMKTINIPFISALKMTLSNLSNFLFEFNDIINRVEIIQMEKHIMDKVYITMNKF